MTILDDIATYKREEIAQAKARMPLAAIESFFTNATGLKILNAAPALKEGQFLFPLVDIVIVNESELAHFSGRTVASRDDIVAAARSLIADNQTAIVTLGGEGACAVSAGCFQ